MKNCLFLLVVFISATSFGQDLQDSHKANNGAIRSDGRVVDAHANRIGQFQPDGTIEGRSTILGYIRGGKVEDNNHKTLGYIRSDGTVEDKDHNKIGDIQSDGRVEDSHSTAIGFASGINKEWAAVYYFFIRFK